MLRNQIFWQSNTLVIKEAKLLQRYIETNIVTIFDTERKNR